jgi:hypothetical protein
MHRLLSRIVLTRTPEVRPAEPARPRIETSITKPPAVRRRSLNEAAHKQRR